MEEFYIESDGIKLHAKLDKPEGVDKGPLCILIHGFTGHMEEEHLLAATKAFLDIGVMVLRVEMYGHGMSGGIFRDHTQVFGLCDKNVSCGTLTGWIADNAHRWNVSG